MSKKFLAGIMAVIIVVTLSPCMLMGFAENPSEIWTFDDDEIQELGEDGYGKTDGMQLKLTKTNTASGDKVEIAEDPISGSKALKFTKVNDAEDITKSSTLSAKIMIPERLKDNIVKISFDLRVENMNGSILCTDFPSIYHSNSGRITQYNTNVDGTYLYQRTNPNANKMYEIAKYEDKYLHCSTVANFATNTFSSSNAFLDGSGDTWNVATKFMEKVDRLDNQMGYLQFELGLRDKKVIADSAVFWMDNLKIEAQDGVKLISITTSDVSENVSVDTEVFFNFDSVVNEALFNPSENLSVFENGVPIDLNDIILNYNNQQVIAIFPKQYSSNYTVVYKDSSIRFTTSEMKMSNITLYDFDSVEIPEGLEGKELVDGINSDIGACTFQIEKGSTDSLMVARDPYTGSNALRFKKGLSTTDDPQSAKSLRVSVTLPGSVDKTTIGKTVKVSYDLRIEQYNKDRMSSSYFPGIYVCEGNNSNVDMATVQMGNSQIDILGGDGKSANAGSYSNNEKEYRHIEFTIDMADRKWTSYVDNGLQVLESKPMNFKDSGQLINGQRSIARILFKIDAKTNTPNADAILWVDNFKIEDILPEPFSIKNVEALDGTTTVYDFEQAAGKNITIRTTLWNRYAESKPYCLIAQVIRKDNNMLVSVDAVQSFVQAVSNDEYVDLSIKIPQDYEKGKYKIALYAWDCFDKPLKLADPVMLNN